MNKLFFTLLILSFFSLTSAWPNHKVIVLRGEATLTHQGQSSPLSLNQEVPEGAAIETKAKSLVKVLMSDKTQLSLGPESKMQLTLSPQEKKAGLVDLVKGQVFFSRHG